ncbi:hypothetical protein Ancab_016886 [Ancistrocladus abbreviatus]
MGRAARWLKAIFGLKSNRNQKEPNLNSGDRRDKKRSSIGHSRRDSGSSMCHNPETIPPNITAAEAAWLKSYYADSEKEQNKHAIAVAAATAAAADAAVAAAQAAVAVVRLTSHGRGTMFAGGRERWAAVKIQTTFRGYLARKALRALRALVKLQALVRGYLVRKQATATFHGMQALIRAQATVKSKRAQGFIKKDYSRPQLVHQAHRSMEMFDDNRTENFVSAHSRRLSASFETKTINPIDDSPKVVEVDTGRPRSTSRRPNTECSECGDDSSYQKLPNSPCFQFTSPHLSIPNSQDFHDQEWGFTGEECRCSTAQSTPRFMNSCWSNPPLTPAKSVCADNFLRQYTNHPNYMANTQSFKAKLRSQSAPKQRPEPGSKKRLSLSEMMESRNSLSGVRMQRSCSQAQEAINFRIAVMGKLDKSSDYVRESAQRHYAPRK